MMNKSMNYPNLLELSREGYEPVTTGYHGNESELFHKAVEQLGDTDHRIAKERGQRFICRRKEQIKL